jgi:hypothetical protein
MPTATTLPSPEARPASWGSLPGGVGAGCVPEGQAVYRPRHPEKTAFYQLLEEHFDRYVEVHEERFEPKDGPLRAVVRPAVEAFLDGGRLENGFARLRCESCKRDRLLPFSCQGRNFCPRCQAKRAALFAEHLRQTILAPVGHRHLIVTIPRALRGLFERERKRLALLARSAYEAVRKSFAAALGRKDVVPGFVASLQTFGAFAPNFHPHVHAIASEGAFTRQGEFLRLDSADPRVIEEVFRREVIARLCRAERLSETFRDSCVSTPPDPRTGATEVVLDPLDWIHLLTGQIPEPRAHPIRYFGAYSRRRLSQRRREETASRLSDPSSPPAAGVDEGEESAFVRGRRANWARLLRKILEVDPLLCPCGGQMKIVAVITDPRVIDRILRHRQSRGHRDPFDSRASPVR